MKTADARISSPGGMNMRLIAFGGDERMRGALLAAGRAGWETLHIEDAADVPDEMPPAQAAFRREHPPRPRCAASPSPRARRPAAPRASSRPRQRQSIACSSLPAMICGRPPFSCSAPFLGKKRSRQARRGLDGFPVWRRNLFLLIPASTCSAGSGSRRRQSRPCRTGRCALAWPERLPASCGACSSRG